MPDERHELHLPRADDGWHPYGVTVKHVTAPTPAGSDKYAMFENRLRKMARHLGKWAARQDISCYRVYDCDIPQFPISIDLYENKLYICEYERPYKQTDAEREHWRQRTIEAICSVLEKPREAAHFRLRKRQRSLDQYEKLDRKRNGFVVREGGLKFLVNLDDYLDTGLFLDHRILRGIVRREAAGTRFLNLFAYTGSFSVYAAAGGASATETVDLSNTYLEWAGRNLELNALQSDAHKIVKADVLEYLRRPPGRQFDLAVLDPPTFSNSRKIRSMFDVQTDYAHMINDVLRHLVPGGTLYFSTNFTKFQLDPAALNARTISEITKQTTSKDFERAKPRRCYRITAG